MCPRHDQHLIAYTNTAIAIKEGRLFDNLISFIKMPKILCSTAKDRIVAGAEILVHKIIINNSWAKDLHDQTKSKMQT